MKQVIVKAFGGPENLVVEHADTPLPEARQVLVRLTSIGINHADLMARRGEYKLASGDPPFTPGLEAGGIIEATGEDCRERGVGQRVILSPAATRDSPMKGTYRSHFIVDERDALPAPDAIGDEQLGAIWLTYLTAWGCLIWKQQLRENQVVAIPAASSGVGLAAAQIAKHAGATTLGLTRTQAKADRIAALDAAAFDHLIVTHEEDGTMRPWHRQIRQAIGDGGVDVFFDPVAGGEYLTTEIKCLAQGGTVWVYGLLASVGLVDVFPLIRKHAAVRGWMLTEMVEAGRDIWEPACQALLEGFAAGTFHQHVDQTFPLDDAAAAHETMERGEHVGKLVLLP